MLETRQIDSMVVVKIEPQGIFELLGRKGEVARERLALRDGYDARIGMGRLRDSRSALATIRIQRAEQAILRTHRQFRITAPSAEWGWRLSMVEK
jgi:adenylate cyclase